MIPSLESRGHKEQHAHQNFVLHLSAFQERVLVDTGVGKKAQIER